MKKSIAFLIKKKCPFKIVSDVSYVLQFNTELFGVKTFSLCIADLIILPFLCMISRMFIDKSVLLVEETGETPRRHISAC
jgi:hypothetical protein